MNHFIHKYKIILFTALSLVLYALIIYVSKTDTNFIHRWFIFWLYVLSLGSVVLFYTTSFSSKKILPHLNKKEIIFPLCLLVIVAVVSFIFLKNYPYISVQDEVRDAGENAVRVINGEMRNFFAYGDYNGYGNIISVIASFFYRVFGSSVYTYRFPAALVSILDVALLYFLIRLLIDRRIAFLGSLVYASLALHLFYARTELVVIFDSFWTTAILLIFFIWFQKRRLPDLILLGTVLGFASTFHSALRIISLAVLLVVIFLEIQKVFFQDLKKSVGILVFVLFCFIGFGPTILYNTPKTFFQSEKLYNGNFQERKAFFNSDEIKNIETNYAKSLMVWFYEPTTSRYVTPLFPPIFGLLFVLGIGYAVFVSKKPFLYILLGFVFILPLTNSAITNWLNADHRLMPLLPIGTVFVALGIRGVFELFSNRASRIVLLSFLGLYIGYQIFSFFYYQQAVKQRNIKDFLSMHTIYFLKSFENKANFAVNPTDVNPGSNKICLYVSQANADNLDLLHYQGQYRYFLPQYERVDKVNDAIGDNEVYIFKGDCPDDYTAATNELRISCNGKANFQCPLDYNGDIVIHY